MKIVVIGGSGLIGAQTVEILRKQGLEVISASRRSGVDAASGEGLLEALKGAEVLVDCSRSPSLEGKAAFEFFDNSTRNMLAAAQETGVKHYVALSVVGTENLQDSAFFRAKMAQETQIRNSNLPYTIVQATQFLEFLGGIADASTEGNVVTLTSAKVQPIAAGDVANEMAIVALSAPKNGTIEIAGPERFSLSEIISKYLKLTHDNRQVVVDDSAPYFGVVLKTNSLVPVGEGKLTATKFEDWLSVATK